jgi:hypothetical protein
MSPLIFFDEPGVLRRPGSSKKINPDKLYPPLYVKALGNKNPTKIHPGHGGRRRPTVAMVTQPRRRGIPRAVNTLRYKSTLFELENIIVITNY